MKKFTLILLMAVLLAGGTVAVIPAPVQAQVYEYPPPPADPYAYPWVGPSTPWVYYNGDWFLNGLLYYFFGPDYGWAPYYAYPTIYIVRPSEWYAPRWLRWYKVNPVYWENFTRVYPYWRGHRQGQSYNERFYEDHHRGQGSGWQKGFRGAAPPAPQPVPGRVAPPARPGPAQVAPPERPQPGPAGVAPPERPRPTHVAPPPGPKPGPAPMAPAERHEPGPARMAPPAGPQPGPAHVAPATGPKPAPAPAPKAAPAPPPGKAAPGAPQPEKGGEEKH